MMDFDTWKNMIIDVVTQISDFEYQRGSWFGKGELISSPDELYNGLFDDSRIEEFLEAHAKQLTDDQRRTGLELVRKMNQYAPANVKYLDPATVIEDPLWDELRRSAKSFLSALNADGENH